MIWHFLKRDFKDYQVYWYMVGFFSFFFLIFFRSTGMIIYLYLAIYGCFFLAVLPVNYLTGVTWRAQHVMSRYYLHALPVAHRKLFHFILIRIFVFWIPLWILLLYLPFELNRSIPYRLNFYGAFVLLVMIGSFWLLNVTIGMQLRYEAITRYMYLKQRIRAWIKMLSAALFESAVLVSALFSLYNDKIIYVWTTLTLSFVVAIKEYLSNLKKWA